MTDITKHTPGMFSWADLGTTDVDAAKKFYSSLFGWTYADDPMGPDSFYSRALLDGKDVCAMYKQQAEQAKAGIVPHWAAYVTVESADATAAVVPEAGGTLAMPPFDVFDAGRMTFLMDPTGATIAAWEPKKHIGARVMTVPGALCWAELVTNDTEAAGKFYMRVFGWNAEKMPMGPDAAHTYTVFKVGDQPATGMLSFPPGMEGIPPHWLVYFAVASCDDTVAQVEKLGGQVHRPGTDIPDVGRFAVLADPQGVAFAVLQPAR